jgi:hypothetical protein
LRTILIFIFFIALQTKIYAQNVSKKSYANNFNGWLSYSGDFKFSEKWGLHLDGSWRKNDLFSKPQQSLIRIGVNYYINAQVFIAAGYCFVENAPYGTFPSKASFTENRFWEQIQIKSQLQRFEWVNRFRLEQRFSNSPILNSNNFYEEGPAIYTNRLRVLNRFSIPLKGKTIQDKSYYLSISNEILVSYGKNVAANTLDQNRISFAFGKIFPKIGRLELGYLLQSVYKPESFKVERNHTLQIGLSSSLDFYKKKK